MRLSDIKGDRVLDVIADLIDPVANIAEDPAAAALFRREVVPEGMEPKKFLLKRVRRSVPTLLKTHKEDLITILATVEGVDPDEYRGVLNLVKLVKDCTELLTDEGFTGLFISAQTENSSGSAPETTGAPGQ